MASKLYTWLDSRLRLKPIEKTLLDEPIPGEASWNYVFGSATLFLFVLQAVTGMFLAVYYVPSPDHAMTRSNTFNTTCGLAGLCAGSITGEHPQS